MSYDPDFAVRFADACSTGEPTKVQRLLNIPYQSAKNYLAGRLPTADALIMISGRTGCSIDWLLTGRGKKFFDATAVADTPLSAGQIESVRNICVEVINETIGSIQQPKIVRLQPSDLLSEKVPDPAATSTGRRPSGR